MAATEYEGIYIKDNVYGTVYLSIDSFDPINISFFHNIKIKVALGYIRPGCKLEKIPPQHGLDDSLSSPVSSSHHVDEDISSHSDDRKLTDSKDNEVEEVDALSVEDKEATVLSSLQLTDTIKNILTHDSINLIQQSLSCRKNISASEELPFNSNLRENVSAKHKKAGINVKHKRKTDCQVKTLKEVKSADNEESRMKANVDTINNIKSSQKESEKRQDINSKGKLQQSKEKRNAKWKLACQVTCQYCLKVFENQQSYYDHKKTSRSQAYECCRCAKVFPFQAHLQAHVKAFHQDKKHFSNLKQSSSCVCDVCGSQVKNMFALKKHLMSHTQEYFYNCCICGKQFVEPGTLNNHMSTHKSGGMIKCKCCDQLFATRGALAKHKLASVEVKCHLCGQVFPNRTSRTQHYKVSHQDDILKCSKCTSMFSAAEELSAHMKKHNVYKKKQCKTCGKYFSRLEKHIIVHKAKTEIDESELFVCDKCPKKFTNRSSFQRHLTIHSQDKPYQCPNCPKKFADCGVLRKHLRRHLSVMPYECEVCGKKCKELGNLKVHMRIHSEVKQFQCPLCPQAFNYKSSLEGHKRSRHSQKTNPEDQLPQIPEVRQEYENMVESNIHQTYKTSQLDSQPVQLCLRSSWKQDPGCHQTSASGSHVDMKQFYENRGSISAKSAYEISGIPLMARHTYASSMHLNPVFIDTPAKHTYMEDLIVSSKHPYMNDLANVGSGSVTSLYPKSANSAVGVSANSQAPEDSSMNVTSMNVTMSSMNISLY